MLEPSAFITKENLYTAISRAREKCTIIGTEKDLISCQERLTNKVSLFMLASDNFELPDYSEDPEERYYIELHKESNHIAKKYGCNYDSKKFAWYTYDIKIYKLLKMDTLLKKGNTFSQKDFIKQNGGFYRGKGVWHTYKSNDILKEFM